MTYTLKEYVVSAVCFLLLAAFFTYINTMASWRQHESQIVGHLVVIDHGEPIMGAAITKDGDRCVMHTTASDPYSPWTLKSDGTFDFHNPNITWILANATSADTKLEFAGDKNPWDMWKLHSTHEDMKWFKENCPHNF